MEPNSGYDGSQGSLLFASTITASLCFGSSRFKLGENSKNEKAPAENHTRLCFHFDRYVLQIYLYAFGEDSCQPSVFLHNSTWPKKPFSQHTKNRRISAMTTEADFLSSICDEPTAELRRLVYADWLEEHDKAREATLVRLHHEMLRAADESPASEHFIPEELELRDRIPDKWLKKYLKACGDLLIPISVAGNWFRIRRRIDEEIEPLVGVLADRATPEQIANFEQSIGQELPEDVKHSYRVHNGCHLAENLLFFGDNYLSLDEAQEAWRSLEALAEFVGPSLDDACSSDPENAIQNRNACREWIPITGIYTNHIGVDLAPGPNGRRGQVILFGVDEWEHYVVGQSWADFLEKFAGLLEQVDLEYLPDLCEQHSFQDIWNAHWLLSPEDESFEWYGPDNPPDDFRGALRRRIQDGTW